jgi:ATP-dependent DNA helicase RecG
LLASYAAAVGHPDPARLLRARGLIDRKDNLTIGAVLLFAEQPQQWLPEANVRILRYRGAERGSGSRQQLLEDIRIDGPVPLQLTTAQEAIFRLVPARRALASTGRFERIGLVPRDAWLEGLVNAVIHRSYSISGDHIRIEIFDDRIESEIFDDRIEIGLADPVYRQTSGSVRLILNSAPIDVELESRLPRGARDLGRD